MDNPRTIQLIIHLICCFYILTSPPTLNFSANTFLDDETGGVTISHTISPVINHNDRWLPGMTLGNSCVFHFNAHLLMKIPRKNSPEQSVREQSHHVVAIRGQIHRLVNRYGEIVSEVSPAAEVAYPLPAEGRE